MNSDDVPESNSSVTWGEVFEDQNGDELKHTNIYGGSPPQINNSMIMKTLVQLQE
jgi:hypothetical protein